MEKFKFLGIEIEGGWNDVKRVHPFFKGDSSSIVPRFEHISHYGVLGKHPLYDYPVCGEINSKPLGSRAEIHRWLQNCYPDGFADSCAIHCHVSFNCLTSYAKIMTEHFYNLILERFEPFGKKEVNGKDAAEASFWKRFNGHSQWSRRGFGGLWNSSKSKMMNYHSFIGDNFGNRRYQTFEFRLLPTFEKRATAHKEIKLYIDIIKEVMTTNPPAKKEIANSLKVLEDLGTGIPV